MRFSLLMNRILLKAIKYLGVKILLLAWSSFAGFNLSFYACLFYYSLLPALVHLFVKSHTKHKRASNY